MRMFKPFIALVAACFITGNIYANPSDPYLPLHGAQEERSCGMVGDVWGGFGNCCCTDEHGEETCFIAHQDRCRA